MLIPQLMSGSWSPAHTEMFTHIEDERLLNRIKVNPGGFIPCSMCEVTYEQIIQWLLFKPETPEQKQRFHHKSRGTLL